MLNFLTRPPQSFHEVIGGVFLAIVTAYLALGTADWVRGDVFYHPELLRFLCVVGILTICLALWQKSRA